MISGSIAKRYAKAFIELSIEQHQIETVSREFADFQSKLSSSAPLSAVMTNPSILTEQRLAVLQELLESMKYSDLTRKFLILLAQKRRLDVFDAIVREFSAYDDQRRGVVRVQVTSAVPLTADHESMLVRQIEKLTGRKALVTQKVDPSIMGGIITRMGDLQIDGSLSSRLKRLKKALLTESVD